MLEQLQNSRFGFPFTKQPCHFNSKNLVVHPMQTAPPSHRALVNPTKLGPPPNSAVAALDGMESVKAHATGDSVRSGFGGLSVTG